MEINWKTSLYCLIGNPIDGTYSPIIHNFIYKEEEIDNIYMAFNIKEDKLKETLKGLLSLNVKGFNITAPYKEDIIPFLDEIVEESRDIGAINTVKNKNGKLIGINTDGLGFMKMLDDNNISLKDKRILIIGAGGAAKGISYELIKEDLREISILNRTKERGVKLKKDLNRLNRDLEIEVFGMEEDINKYKFDILINTTTVGMEPYHDKSPIDLDGFKENLIVCDIIYKPLETKLLSEAKVKGFEHYNGVAMLVNQGVLAQEFWLNRSLSRKMTLETIEYIQEYVRLE